MNTASTQGFIISYAEKNGYAPDRCVNGATLEYQSVFGPLKKRVFLSYSWSTNSCTGSTDKLQTWIESLLWIKCWRDQEVLCVGRNMEKQIISGIDNSTAAVCFVSREYFLSLNLQKEFAHALKTKTESEQLLIVHDTDSSYFFRELEKELDELALGYYKEAKQFLSVDSVGMWEYISRIFDLEVRRVDMGKEGTRHKVGAVNQSNAPEEESSKPKHPVATYQTDDKIVVPVLPEGKQFHAFLSHTWVEDQIGRDNHARVKRINEGLKRRGLTTWFDDDRMEGLIDHKMANGISLSCVFVSFITRMYCEKVNGDKQDDNCQQEFCMAKNVLSSAKIIPVPMEEDMLTPTNWKGVVLMTLGNVLYKVAMPSDDDFDEKVTALAEQICEMIAQ